MATTTLTYGILKTTKLVYQDAGSNKFYQVELRDYSTGSNRYHVVAHYGKIGSGLTTRKGTHGDLNEAIEHFQDVVQEKISKGYREETSAGEGPTPAATVSSCPHPIMLLSEGGDVELEQAFNTPQSLLQEKIDGKRFLVDTSSWKGYNRRGVATEIPEWLVQGLDKAPRCVLDGELLNDRYVVFDLLQLGSKSLHDTPYHERLQQLTELVLYLKQPGIQIPDTALTYEDKTQMVERLKPVAEGIVIKWVHGTVSHGRSGANVKVKFWKSASCIVLRNNVQRSVGIGVLDGGFMQNVGNVTIPVNAELPKPGDIIEVKYLYAYPQGSLYQPSYLQTRTDIVQAECTVSQLKYKQINSEDEES